MKKIYLLVLGFMSCFFYSCNDWIELEPEDSLAKETFFNTQEDFNQAITGLYAILRPTDADAVGGAYFGNLYWEVCADVCMWKNSWTQPWFDISRGELNAVTGNVDLVYKNLYYAISWANTIKAEIEAKADNFDEDFVKYVTGQIGFVRALCYIRLTSLWGDVPLVDKIYTPEESKLPRSPFSEIMEKIIIPDLTLAATNLEVTPYDSREGIATKQAAIGMKVRAYLYAEDYENTIKSALELMELEKQNPSEIGFLDNYKDIFSNSNEDNKEILFALKYTAGGYKQGSTFNTTFGSKLPGLPEASMNGSWETVSVLPEFIDSYPS